MRYAISRTETGMVARTATNSVGMWASASYAVLAVGYMAVLVPLLLAGTPFPPPEPYLTVLHLLTLLGPALAVPLWCAVHLAAPAEKKVFTLASLAFVVMLAVVVMINRFVALTLVRQGADPGATGMLDWLQPYGWPSLMLAFEILGWGLFFSLACLFLIPVFLVGRLERAIATALGVTGALSLVSVVALAVDSLEVMGVVAPLAWGLGPLVATVLLGIRFRSMPPAPATP